MENNIIFQCWCIFFTKLVIYKERVEIKHFFGLTTIIIPAYKIASVKKSITGISFETTGGGRTEKIQPWSNKNREKIIEIVMEMTSGKKR